MPVLLVIADDLTGAIDTGVKFSGDGKRINVIAEWKEGWQEEISEPLECMDVVVVNIDSRHDLPEEAGRKVHHMMQWAKRKSIPYIYKKTDATLRGNIGAELEAMAVGAETKNVVFIPAFPEAGRTIKAGICYVNHVPLVDTHFAKDPFNPVHHSRIRDIIREQSEIAVIEYGEFHGTSTDISVPCVELFDCESQKELGQLACVLNKYGKIRYSAGCSAFAGVLNHWYNWNRHEAGELTYEMEDRDLLPILIVCGSVNETALCQLRYAEQVLGYSALTLTPEQKLTGQMTETGADFLKKAGALLQKDQKLIIRAVEGQADMEETDRLGKEWSFDPRSVPGLIADHIGSITAYLLQISPVSIMVLLGGDTLAAVIRHLNIRRIEIMGEIQPGLVDTRMFSHDRCWRVITKSGALGEENMMQMLERYLLKVKKKGEGENED